MGCELWLWELELFWTSLSPLNDMTKFRYYTPIAFYEYWQQTYCMFWTFLRQKCKFDKVCCFNFVQMSKHSPRDLKKPLNVLLTHTAYWPKRKMYMIASCLPPVYEFPNGIQSGIIISMLVKYSTVWKICFTNQQWYSNEWLVKFYTMHILMENIDK